MAVNVCAMDRAGEAQNLDLLTNAETTAATDVELMTRVGRGDREALAAIYDRHAGRLMALSRRILRDGAQAEDLVHDVFVEAWHHAHEFDVRRGSVRAWLTTRTRSRALDRLGYRERSARVLSVVSGASPETDGQNRASAEDQYDAAVLRGSLIDLPPELAQVIDGAYYEGMSAAALAERLGIPIGTVKSRLARAVAQLRERLAGPSSMNTVDRGEA